MDMSFSDWFWFLLTAAAANAPVLLVLLRLPWGSLRCRRGCSCCRYPPAI
ncbi:MAG: hypothetical protein GX595_07290 [Lentisphaerae bacterium]|nr:hypothetical protein [Lentisphaerota bacterium]